MGEPDRVVVRQSTDRLRKPLLAMAPGAALLALTGLALGEMAWLALGAFVIVFVLPLIVVLVMHFRIKRLAQRGENLVYVDWLGREHSFPPRTSRPRGSWRSRFPPVLPGKSAWSSSGARRHRR